MPSVVITGPKTINYIERSTSGSGSIGIKDNSNVLRFIVFDASDESEIREAIPLIAPDTDSLGLGRERADYEWIEGANHWEMTAYYVVKVLSVVGVGSPPPVGTAVKRFSTSGERLHVKTGRSLLQRRVPVPDDSLLSLQTPSTQFVMIGDTGDPKKEPSGVDIIVPVQNFSYDCTIPGVSVDTTYEDLIESLVGTINNATWKGSAAGSVLFSGFQGQITYGQDTTLSFEFSKILPSDYTLGAQTFSKRGWDYIDIHGARREVDPATKRLVTRIDQIDIWEMYDSTDFNLIGIP